MKRRFKKTSVKETVTHFQKSGGEKLIVTDDGEDVIWNMGGKTREWDGEKTSDMVRDMDGKRLLAWVCNKDIGDAKARFIIEEQINEMYEF
jgi:hypothetical protein